MRMHDSLRAWLAAWRSAGVGSFHCLRLGIVLLVVLGAQAPHALAEHIGESARLTVQLSTDTIPFTPEADRLDVHLELHSGAWQVAQIRSSVRPEKAGLRARIRASRSPGAELTRARLQIPHLEFLLSDIDADNDLDVIVLHRSSRSAHSVWLNHGRGQLERVRADRYGDTPFPDDQLSRTDSPITEGSLQVSVLPSLPLLPRSASASHQVAARLIAEPPASDSSWHWRPCGDRAPPAPTVSAA